MKITTITHTAIKGRPVINIIKASGGLNKGKPYAISLDDEGVMTTLIEAYGLTQEEFPLHEVIKDYFSYYGAEEATKILIGKGIITSNPRSIIWVPD